MVVIIEGDQVIGRVLIRTFAVDGSSGMLLR